MTGRRGRRRDQGRVIIAPAESEQRARDLAGAYRHVLRDLLITDRSQVDMQPSPDGGWLVSVIFTPAPGRRFPLA